MEVLAAIFVLTIGIGGAFLMVRQSLSAASINKNRLIAAYLAQEGIEMVRNIRDNNWLAQRTWDIGLSPGNYQIDVSSTALGTAFVTGTYLRFDTNRLYNTSTGSVTPFQRKVSLANTGTCPGPACAKEVKVMVFWSERGRTHYITAMEYLRNWYAP
jgi:hypothetical protein